MAHLPYGTFNPRFHGISIVHADPLRQLDTWRCYHESDVKEWAQKDRAALDDISTLSAVDHETRHFHDFLVATVGTTTMGMRMQASFNGIQTMKAISRCDGTYVPLPLTTWLAWDRGQRESWFESTGRHFGVERLEDVVRMPEPHEVDDKSMAPGAYPVDQTAGPEQLVKTYARGAVSAYRWMQEMRQPRDWGLGLEVAADDVFEGSAHLIQVQSIWTGQGESAAALYNDFLMNADVRYLRPLQILVAGLKRAGKVPAISRLVELFCWMLFGPYADPRSGGNPAVRFTQILAMVAEAPDRILARQGGESTSIWDDLDQWTGCASWRANLADAEAAADRRKQSYARLAKENKGGYFDSLFAVADAWHDDQRMSRSRVREDPASYANPLRYLTEDGYFPVPSFEVRFASHVHERDDALALPGSRAVAVDDEGKRVLSYVSCPDGAKGPSFVDHLVRTRIMTHLIDYLFLDEPAVTLYDQYWRHKMEGLIGKKLISVF